MINTETTILDYLKEKSLAPEGQYVIHIKISKLSEENRKDYRLHLVSDVLKSLVKVGKCKYYHLFNDDFLMFFSDKDRDDINTALLRIKFHFAADPEIVMQKTALLVIYRLSKDAKQLREYIKELYKSSGAADDPVGREYEFEKGRLDEDSFHIEVQVQDKSGYAASRSMHKPLTPKLLGMIEKNLEKSDFTSMIRMQPVCAVFGKSQPQPLFDEVFVSISDLQETLIPDINLTAAPWLFKHLSAVLDRRVLSNIRKQDYGALKLDFSINLNTQNIISAEFSRFDEKINPGLKSTIILELNPSDVFSDLHTFILARNFAKSKGYRLCLDSVQLPLLDYIDREKLGIDLVKILWSGHVVEAANADVGKLRETLGKFGTDRVILRNVDDATAVDVGQRLGISLFQGRYISRLLSEDPHRRRIGTTLLKK